MEKSKASMMKLVNPTWRRLKAVKQQINYVRDLRSIVNYRLGWQDDLLVMGLPEAIAVSLDD